MELSSNKKIFNLLGAIFLIAGTAIGGGMLALPLDSGDCGFFPSLVVMFLCWCFMTTTSLLYAEANLWLEEGAHVMTMARRLLGTKGKFVAILVFLFINYTSLVAYVAGGGSVLEILSLNLFGWTITRWQASILFCLFFGFIVYLGTRRLERINAVLFAAMIGSYVLLILIGISEVNVSLLLRKQWGYATFSFPLMLTVFSHQAIIPSLTPYLNRDPKQIRIAIICGTSIPLLVYILWQYVVLGLTPYWGEYGLKQALEEGRSAAEYLGYFVKNPWLIFCANFFAFFAIATSFLGISLAVYDFLADGLKIAKKGLRKFGLGMMVLLPALTMGLIFPNVFEFALEISGGFGDAIINGMIPALMVWSGRYVKHYEQNLPVPGKRYTLFGVLIFSTWVVIVQIWKLFF